MRMIGVENENVRPVIIWAEHDPIALDSAVPQACTLHVTDQYGAPGKFCTDTACVLQQADERGIVSFGGAPNAYPVQLLTAPKGYSFDPDFEITTDAVYGERGLRIRRD